MPETYAAIVIAAKHGELIKVRDYSGITNTVGALRCKFEFRTNDWDNATMTAVFCKGNMATNPEIVDGAIGVLLDSIDECAVPAEVLTRDAKYFSVGVWGVTAAGFRIVSKWLVFRIEDGCYVDATEPIEPTPTVYEQIMSALSLKAPVNHEHNDIYYTKKEIDGIITDIQPDSNKDLIEQVGANTKARHTHSNNQVLNKFSEDNKGNPLYNGKAIVSELEETDPTVPSWAKQPGKPKYTASEVGALPNTTKIPSATSDLTNNSGFITKDVNNLANYHIKSEVYTKTEINNKGYLTEHQDLSSYAKKSELPTKTSNLENTSGFITKAVDDLANYYLKSETYTQAEINQMISTIPKLSIKVVDALPQTDIDEATIYLLKDGKLNGNLYTEYIYTNGTWEILGSQQIDLTGYAKSEDIKTEVESALAEAKVSGEFKGDTGEKGDRGEKGEKGDPFTYQDFTPEQIELLKGSDGADGENGVSATHEWNGTVLTITSANGTSSADLKGERGDSGVYVGTDAMPEDCNVKIDPTGEVIVIPTKISELINDSGFITADQLPERDITEEIEFVIGSLAVDETSEGTSITTSTVSQNLVDNYNAMMAEVNGDFDKIPFIAHTDHHGRYDADKFNLVAEMANFTQISKCICLGDVVTGKFNTEELSAYNEAIKSIPLRKRIEIAGNHDIWGAGYGGEGYHGHQNFLTPYFKNWYAKRGGTQGFFSVCDDYYNVKYVVANAYDYISAVGINSSTRQMSTAQADFIIRELSADDGYDVIWLSHQPIASVNSEPGETFLKDETQFDSFLAMISARKNKTSGTFTDSEGVEHSYDFTGCKTELLCSLHGHSHKEVYQTFENGITEIIFDMYRNAGLYVGYVDRKNKKVKFWKSSNTTAVEVDI